MRMIHLAALALVAVFPASAQVAEAPTPRSFEIELDPPGQTSLDPTRACRQGTLSSGPHNTPMSICIEAMSGSALDVSLYIPAANVSEHASLIDRPGAAVAILSDPRYRDFWPVIIHYGGEDGRKFVATALRTRKARAAAVASGAAAGDQVKSLLDGRGRRAVAEAETLSAWGLTDAALAVLDEALPEPDRNGRLSDKAQNRLMGVELRRGGIYRRAGRTQEAIDQYRSIETQSLLDSDLRLNGAVNRAATLADMGDAAEALALIDAAGRLFAVETGEDVVEGSQRQFDWIRSCALHRLGREEEAKRVIAGTFDRTIASRGIFFIPTNDSIEERYRRCILDKEWFAERLKRDLESPFPHVGLFLFFASDVSNERMPGFAEMAQAMRAESPFADELALFREPPPGWRDLIDYDRRSAIAGDVLRQLKK